MKDQWLVIINPQSGGGKAKQVWKTIRPIFEKRSVFYQEVFTEYPLHAIELVRKGIEQGFRKIVAVGGDGTVSEVVNGICHQDLIPTTDIIFTAIPTGTGNDWARYHGLKRKAEKIVQTIQSGKIVHQDVGKITYKEGVEEKIRYFNNVAGMGFESFVTYETRNINKVGFIGQSGYLLGVLKNLFRFESKPLSVEGDGFSYEKTCFLLTIGLCRYNGNGMNIVPLSIADDGLFDVTLIDEISPWNVIRHILKIYNGRIYHHPKATHYRTTRLKIQGHESSFLEADGEVLGNVPIEVELIPGALRVKV